MCVCMCGVPTLNTSHLYSPNVPSSSFMGWISGSWWASSFSFTVVHLNVRLRLPTAMRGNVVVCALPGYLPPLFLLMKQIMRRTKMRRAMAHIRPINHPWVAMSTWRLGTAADGDKVWASGWKNKLECVSLHMQQHLEGLELKKNELKWTETTATEWISWKY